MRGMPFTTPTRLFPSLVIGTVLVLGACGDDDVTPGTDAGPGADAGVTMTPDSGTDAGMMRPISACEGVRMVAGMMGTTTVTGDTSMVTSRPVDLGTDCGNAMAGRPEQQEVIAYTVPGTGPTGLRLSLRNPGTPPDFLSLLQVRDACATIPTAAHTCFLTNDDDWRAEGAVMAEGGSTIYIVVTGYAEPPAGLGVVSRGPWELTIETVVNAAPTLAHGAAWYSGEAVELAVAGADDGVIESYRAELLDAAAMPVDVNADGAADVLGGAFLGTVMGSPFTAYDHYNALRALLSGAAVTQLSVVVTDEFGLGSAPLVIAVSPALGAGATCGDMAYCAVGLECASMLCAGIAPVATACGSATAITIATPTTTTTSAMVSGTVPTGAGVLAASCTRAQEGEALYTVVVPAGAFDLLATTAVSGTGTTDTVLSMRANCVDPTTELACNDDIDYAAGTYTSRIEARDVAAGTYALIVEQYDAPGMAGAFGMQVSLRPVLAAGAACDMAGVMNRCAGAACAAGMCP